MRAIQVVTETGKLVEEVEVDEEEYFKFAMRWAEHKGERKGELKLLEKCRKFITAPN